MPVDICPLCGYKGSGPLCTECGEARLEECDQKLLRYQIVGKPRLIIWLFWSLAVGSWVPTFGLVTVLIIVAVTMFISANASIHSALVTLSVMTSVVAILTCLVVVTWLANLRSFRNMSGAKCLRMAGLSTVVLSILYFVSLDVMQSWTIARPIGILAKAAVGITLWSTAVLCASIWRLTRSSRYRNGTRIVSREYLSLACKFVALWFIAMFIVDLLPGFSSMAEGKHLIEALGAVVWLVGMSAIPVSLTLAAIAVQNELQPPHKQQFRISEG